jgi:hypothetical protein
MTFGTTLVALRFILTTFLERLSSSLMERYWISPAMIIHLYDAFLDTSGYIWHLYFSQLLLSF